MSTTMMASSSSSSLVSPTPTPLVLSEPLALLSGELRAHALLMMFACIVLLPLGVLLARRRSGMHTYVQSAALFTMSVGVFLALLAGTRHAQRDADAFDKLSSRVHIPVLDRMALHLVGVVAGDYHEHAWVHSLAGMALLGALYVQWGTGCIADIFSRTIDELHQSRIGQMHRWLGCALIFVLLPAQQLTGFVAVFQLADSRFADGNGIIECVGHIALAVVLAVCALFYYTMLRNQAHNTENVSGSEAMASSRRIHLKRSYSTLGVESALGCLIGVLALFYHVFSAWPFDSRESRQHVANAFFMVVVGGISLGTIVRRARDSRMLPDLTVRGIAFTAVMFSTSLAFLRACELTEYGTVLHKTVGALVGVACVLRALLCFRLLALTLNVAAFVVVASQAGFAALYTQFYHRHISIGGAIALCVAAGTLTYIAEQAYVLVWSVRPAPPHSHTTASITRKSVDEIFMFHTKSDDDADAVPTATHSDLSARVASLVNDDDDDDDDIRAS